MNFKRLRYDENPGFRSEIRVVSWFNLPLRLKHRRDVTSNMNILNRRALVLPENMENCQGYIHRLRKVYAVRLRVSTSTNVCEDVVCVRIVVMDISADRAVRSYTV